MLTEVLSATWRDKIFQAREVSF